MSPTEEGWRQVTNIVRLDLANPGKQAHEQHEDRETAVNQPPRHQNLLFGRFKLSLAREAFSERVEAIAPRYGVSPRTWRSYEVGARRMPLELRSRVEADVKRQMMCVIVDGDLGAGD